MVETARRTGLSRRALLGAAAAFPVNTVLPARAQPAADNDVLDVAIIGAGLAGLTAARDLSRADHLTFVVLEASERVGGRTLNLDLGNVYVSEAGGQWIGPGQTAIADLARELNVGTFPTYYEGKTVFLAGDGKVVLDLEGTFGTDETVAAQLDALARTVPSGAPWQAETAQQLDRRSLGDWLAEQNFPPIDRIGWNMSAFLTTGVMPAKMSLLHFLSMISSANGRYVELDSIKNSAQETRFVGGSQILSIKMAQALDEQILLNTPVLRISNWNAPVVTIETTRGQVKARQVVLALSPALCNRITFDPPLPAARQALQSAWPAHSPARKVTLVYDTPFWRAQGLNGHIMQAGGPVVWAFDNSPPDGSLGVINAFVMQAMVPSDLGQTRDMLTEIYAKAWGEQARHPVQIQDHDWSHEPYAMSCVSAIPPGFWTRHGKALHPSVGNLIWSGTETAKVWAGYMDGAVRSGHAAALEVLDRLGKSAAIQMEAG